MAFFSKYLSLENFETTIEPTTHKKQKPLIRGLDILIIAINSVMVSLTDKA